MYKVITNGVEYSWDENKNRLNIEKHGVCFEDAISVFEDEMTLMISDLFHSDEEERFIALGMNFNMQLLYVVHCYRSNYSIRIISARKATKGETELYARKLLK